MNRLFRKGKIYRVYFSLLRSDY